ncbi:hypothetical protein EMIHUDRAFT_470199, partial [Emiliania huxleyi CCMP1516]|uniref:Uncharacterized protein n=2 Tax=Emiliania huxleyi TaxID=2903 RepID=A0A0D3J5B0_EMIH1
MAGEAVTAMIVAADAGDNPLADRREDREAAAERERKAKVAKLNSQTANAMDVVRAQQAAKERGAFDEAALRANEVAGAPVTPPVVLGTGPARWLYGEDPVKSSAAGAAMELRFVWRRSSSASTGERSRAPPPARLEPPPRPCRTRGALKLALDEIDGLDATFAPLELRGTTNSLACNEFSKARRHPRPRVRRPPPLRLRLLLHRRSRGVALQRPRRAGDLRRRAAGRACAAERLGLHRPGAQGGAAGGCAARAPPRGPPRHSGRLAPLPRHPRRRAAREAAPAALVQLWHPLHLPGEDERLEAIRRVGRERPQLGLRDVGLAGHRSCRRSRRRRRRSGGRRGAEEGRAAGAVSRVLGQGGRVEVMVSTRQTAQHSQRSSCVYVLGPTVSPSSRAPIVTHRCPLLLLSPHAAHTTPRVSPRGFSCVCAGERCVSVHGGGCGRARALASSHIRSTTYKSEV